MPLKFYIVEFYEYVCAVSVCLKKVSIMNHESSSIRRENIRIKTCFAALMGAQAF